MGDLNITTSSAGSARLAQAQGDLALKNLKNRALRNSSEDTPNKIGKAAHDFESILVGQWLEKAEKSFATVPGSDPDEKRDSARDQFQSIACQFMAQGLTKGGSFGIAAMIGKQLTAVAANQTGESNSLGTAAAQAAVTLESPK
jgi:Rod binding domain-containing protein